MLVEFSFRPRSPAEACRLPPPYEGSLACINGQNFLVVAVEWLLVTTPAAAVYRALPTIHLYLPPASERYQGPAPALGYPIASVGDLFSLHGRRYELMAIVTTRDASGNKTAPDMLQIEPLGREIHQLRPLPQRWHWQSPSSLMLGILF